MLRSNSNRIRPTIIATVSTLMFAAITPDGQAQALKLAGKYTGTSSTTTAVSADTDTLRLSTTSQTFRQELTLESTQDTITDVRVSMTLFTAPDGTQRTPAWTVNKQSGTAQTAIAATQAAVLSLSLTTPVAGRYQSTIALIYSGKRWSIPVVITRTRLEPSLDIPELNAVRSWVNRAGDVQVRLTITEKAGQDVRLFKPVLSSLVSVLLAKTDRKTTELPDRLPKRSFGKPARRMTSAKNRLSG